MSANGAMARVPKALRQNAIASAGAAVAAMSGAEVEIAATATAMRPTSRGAGRPTALGRGRPRSTSAIAASWQDARMDPRVLVEEAGRASAVLWVRLPDRSQPLAAWYAWVDGAAVVVHDGDEQQLPGLRAAGHVELVLRSKDKGACW